MIEKNIDFYCTKEQAFEYFIQKLKQPKIYQYRHINYKPMSKERCLSCGKTIYVSYKEFSRSKIFCDICHKSYINKPTIVQYNYMSFIKNKQLEQSYLF